MKSDGDWPITHVSKSLSSVGVQRAVIFLHFYVLFVLD